jgi:hypothetical protein
MRRLTGDLRQGQVGGDMQHAQHLGDVAEAGEPVFIRKLRLTTWPKVAAQLSNTSMPAASSRLGRR